MHAKTWLQAMDHSAVCRLLCWPPPPLGMSFSANGYGEPSP